jgi:hypothetical protein
MPHIIGMIGNCAESGGSVPMLFVVRAAHVAVDAMRMLGFGVLAVWFSVAIIACNTHDPRHTPPGADGDVAMSCSGGGPASAFFVASAALDSSRVHLDEAVELVGAGATFLLAPQSPVAGLRWQGGHLFMLVDNGFWDIEPRGSARWYPTATALTFGIRAGDLEGDGDQDMMLLSIIDDDMASTDSPTPRFVTRLSVWERTARGLVERAEILRSSGLILPMPYVFGDVDGDADLDIVTYERGQPIGYIHDGSFGFMRAVLGETAPEYVDSLVIAVAFADRNGDGTQDLLVAAGAALEANLFTLLRDSTGRYSLPGPATKDKAPLVPYGPMGNGIAIADVTGDGIADVVAQDADISAPHIRLIASLDARSLVPAVQVDGLGFEFADIDEDGTLDIVTTMSNRLLALMSRGSGVFETRDLGIDLAMPNVIDFTTDPGEGDRPARLHVLYNLPCHTCDASCAGRCVFNTCVACLADDDCPTGRCENQTCTP